VAFDCSGATGILSAAELRRADRYHFAEDRQRYIAGRATLKRVLGERTGIPPAEIVIEEGDWTKPRLAPQAGVPRVCFNVSHSGDYALVALTEGVEVGVDIEQIRTDCPIDDLARRYYSVREHRYLKDLPAARKLRDFYRLWTVKEAVLKCTGVGLSVPPASVNVRLSPDLPPEIHLDSERGFAQQMSVRELTLADGYVSALAVESREQISVNTI